jgi:transposase
VLRLPAFKFALQPTANNSATCGSSLVRAASSTTRVGLSSQHTAAENRKTQAKFVCAECGFSAHADFVGALNMKEAGLALLPCSQPSPEARASCQEPPEVTRVPSCA